MSDPVYTKEQLVDGRIICYRFKSTGEEASGKWFDEITAIFANWDAGKPLLLLLDVSQSDNQLSSEALRISHVLSHADPAVTGKTALLINGSKPAQNIQAVVEHVLADTRERKIFSSEDEAIAWLLKP